MNGGATEAVMEVSSHALHQERVSGLHFDVAIFTNLTRDHLDYHGSMENYFAAKRKLFDGSAGPPPRAAILNQDDPYGAMLKQSAHTAGSELVYTYGLHQGDFRAEGLQMEPSGMRFVMVTPQGKVPMTTRLTGKVNIYNLLAAGAAADARGLTLDEVVQGAASLDCVPGRFQSVDGGQNFAVVVDYAHTDDALRNIIAVAREFVAQKGGRVITMFGCGGDRDRTKRPLMGRRPAKAAMSWCLPPTIRGEKIRWPSSSKCCPGSARLRPGSSSSLIAAMPSNWPLPKPGKATWSGRQRSRKNADHRRSGDTVR